MYECIFGEGVLGVTVIHQTPVFVLWRDGGRGGPRNLYPELKSKAAICRDGLRGEVAALQKELNIPIV